MAKGILYLLFFWTFIPAIVALVEAIQFFTMSDEEFGRRVVGSVASPAHGNRAGSLDQLEKLNELREKGAVSEEEFEQKKKELLGL